MKDKKNEIGGKNSKENAHKETIDFEKTKKMTHEEEIPKKMRTKKQTTFKTHDEREQKHFYTKDKKK